jgi:hypothetical protein
LPVDDRDLTLPLGGGVVSKDFEPTGFGAALIALRTISVAAFVTAGCNLAATSGGTDTVTFTRFGKIAAAGATATCCDAMYPLEFIGTQ